MQAERVRLKKADRNSLTLTKKMGDVLRFHRIKNICVNVARKL